MQGRGTFQHCQIRRPDTPACDSRRYGSGDAVRERKKTGRTGRTGRTDRPDGRRIADRGDGLPKDPVTGQLAFLFVYLVDHGLIGIGGEFEQG